MKIRRSLLWVLLALNIVAAAAYVSLARKNSRPVRVYMPAVEASESSVQTFGLPAFSLTDHTGRTVTDADFKGRVWVFDFIYTDCPAQCPMMSTKMSALQSALPAQVGFASISVNPAKDSPKVLTDYAARYGADTARWKFLTGPLEQIHKLQNALGAPDGDGADAHSVRFYLVDKTGKLAGAYDSTGENGVKQLSEDAKKLA